MTNAIVNLSSVAEDYLRAGLSVLPADRPRKHPLVPWKEFQVRLPTADEVGGWFARETSALCLVCGAVSGHLEVIDFDAGGEKYEQWRALVEEHAPGLLDSVVIERTPSGGFHVAYRSEGRVSGNSKLAERRFEVECAGEVVVHGKTFKPRQDRRSGKWHITITLIETRGEGGLFLCAPSPGYELVQGQFTALPVVTEDEREVLLACAMDLSEVPREVIDAPRPRSPSRREGDRPGDEFNARGDVRNLLVKHGWALARRGENEYWRRPGKDRYWSATLKNRLFYVHSSNAAPFAEAKAYSPFAVYTLLEHDGDYSAAATDLRKQGYGMHSNGQAPERHPENAREPPSQPTTPEAENEDDQPHIVTVRELVNRTGPQREPVIEGLLRRGETINIIAPPKRGKSWLVLQLAVAVASGRPFLGRFAIPKPREILLLDNELHSETLAYRIPRVVVSSGLTLQDVQDRISVDCLRGRNLDIQGLGRYLRHVKLDRFGIIGLDAFYRFMPPDADENDNGTMTILYNLIDEYATRLGSSFVLVHHSSKGNQSSKSVTDVGAGAGAQSRAVDTHLILREHEEPNVVVLEAAARSWPSIEPLCLRWQYPLWTVAEDLDPSALRSGRPSKGRGANDSTPKRVWTVEEFVAEYITEAPRSKAELRTLTRGEDGLSWRVVDDLTETAERHGLIYRRTVGRGHKHLFSTVPPEVEASS